MIIFSSCFLSLKFLMYFVSSINILNHMCKKDDCYYKQFCTEHWRTRVSFSSGFLSVYAQQWDFWVIRQFYFQFFKESPHCPTKTYKWLTNTWKDAQHYSLSEKCKSEPQWGTISHWSKWLQSKSLQTINAGEGVEKREPSYTFGGNAN